MKRINQQSLRQYNGSLNTRLNGGVSGGKFDGQQTLIAIKVHFHFGIWLVFMYLNSDYFVNNSNACVLGDEINVLLTYLFFLSLVIFAMIFYCAYEYEIFGKKENCIWDLLI